MSRTVLLLIAVVVLGAGTYLATAGGDVTERKISDSAEDRQFAYRALEDIREIRVADRAGHQVTLTRGGPSGWLADGVPANEHIVKTALATIRQLDVRNLPAQAMVPVMIKDLAANGILVQLFDALGNKLRGYYIGGVTPDGMGNYAIKEGSENPYIVAIPGFSGNVRFRFEHWGDEWRDKVYFRVDPERIERFSIEYPKQRDQSFVLTRQGDRFELSPVYETGQPTRMIPQGGVEGLLTKYEKYYVNTYENRDREAIDQFRSRIPFAIIRIKQEGREAQEMIIHPRYKEDTFSNDLKTGAVIKSGGLVAYSAFINGGEDWVLLNVETLQPLLYGYDRF